ncbi:MAG TPA: MerR family transcriptional regulator [Acidimicrobiales bacterium]|nr:MerR family transcriptional regulator [Acidimicrobiales bacterium]
MDDVVRSIVFYRLLLGLDVCVDVGWYAEVAAGVENTAMVAFVQRGHASVPSGFDAVSPRARRRPPAVAMSPPRLTIGEFSRLCRLTVVTLRHYERVGLLMPAEVDSATGYRYYRAEQVATALQIGMLRSLDVPITDLRSFVEGSVSLDELLAAQRRRLASQLREQQRMIDVIDALAAGAAPPPFEVTRGIEPERRAAGLTIATSWARVEQATQHGLARVAVSLRRAGIEPGAVTGALFPITPSERMTVTVFVAVDDVDAHRPLAPVGLPSVDAVSTVHRGDHRLLGHAYHALLGQVAAAGLEATGPAREYYLDGGAEGVACTRLVIPIRAHRRG